MMNIYKEAPQYSLRLVKGLESDGVDLVIVRPDGSMVSDGYILAINEVGIVRYGGVNKNAAKQLGLPLDSQGYLAINPGDSIFATQADTAKNDEEEEW